MKTTSRFALAAGASLLLCAAITPVKAADLGGGCCADLEERVAELEATTARKGNRVVSLQVYGQVSKALLIFDNGNTSDAYVVDNVENSSRVGLKGKATIKPGLSAGYNIEFEINNARSDRVYDGKGGNHPEASLPAYWDGSYATGYDQNTFLIRQNYGYIESETLGRISIGHQSSAADYAQEVNLTNSQVTSNVQTAAGVTVASNGALSTKSPLYKWAGNLDGNRYDVIRYDTPSILGFILSATWGENDYADVAVRFKKEFGDFRIAAALAYQWDSTRGTDDWWTLNTSGTGAKFEALGGSVSLMHVPTGLYVNFAAAERQYNGTTLPTPLWDGTIKAAAYKPDTSFWYLQGGIERKLLPYGATTIYGEYGEYDDYLGTANAAGVTTKSTKATRAGFGLNQKIDAAAMDVFLQAQFWSFEDSTTTKYEDLSTVLIGSRIQF